nr:MAG TPA: hypothetical protein [Caudoviricetes sp.]
MLKTSVERALNLLTYRQHGEKGNENETFK